MIPNYDNPQPDDDDSADRVLYCGNHRFYRANLQPGRYLFTLRPEDLD